MVDFKIVPNVLLLPYADMDEQIDAEPNPAGFATLLLKGVRICDAEPVFFEAARLLKLEGEDLYGAIMQAARNLRHD